MRAEVHGYYHGTTPKQLSIDDFSEFVYLLYGFKNIHWDVQKRIENDSIFYPVKIVYLVQQEQRFHS